YMISQTEGVGNLPNPADLYGPTADNANAAINNALTTPYTPDRSLTDAGRNLLTSDAANAPPPPLPELNLPGAPTLNQPAAPGTYSSNYTPPSFQNPNLGDPTFQNLNTQRFNSGGIAGPGQTNVRDATGGFAGPEGLRASTDPLAQQAFQKSLATQEGLAGTDASGLQSDLTSERDLLFEAAARAGQNRAGATGFTDPRGNITGGAIGEAVGLEAARQANAAAEQRIAAARLAQEGKIAGAGGLTELGGTAAGATRGTQALNLDQVVKEFNAGTGRGKAVGDLMQQADQMRQSGNIDGYNSLTQRIATEGNISVNEARNMIDGFRATTQRAQVVDDARQRAADRGFNYDQMANQNSQFAASLNLDYDQLTEQAQARGADNLLDFNQQLMDVQNNMASQGIDAFTASSNALRDHYANETDRIDTIVNGMTDIGGLELAQDKESNDMRMRAATLAAGLVDGHAGATIAYNELQRKAMAGDQNALMELFIANFSATQQTMGQARNNKQRNKEQDKALFGKLIPSLNFGFG
ncbi:MAG: hypothetical protein ACE5FA_09215, partial [Dehalococcoidia bacterium]